jgi:RHS repeat-associated protein
MLPTPSHTQQNRCFLSSAYRYAFQAQEKDDEIKGEGNSVNYTYRMHDTRLGRFFAIDPLTSKYPYLTPYQFSSNQPIHAVELEGLESSNPLGAPVEWVEKAVNSAGALFNIIDNQTPSSSSNTVQTDVKNTAELTNTFLVAAAKAYNIANNIEVKVMANLNIRLSAGGRAAFSVEKVMGSDVDLGSVTLVSFEGSLNLRTGELNGTFNYLGKDGEIVFTQGVSKSVPAGLPGIGVGASTSTEEIINMENRATEQLTKELEAGYGVGIFQAAGVLKTTENAVGNETEAGGKFGTGGAVGIGYVVEAEANVEITIGVKTP